ncbi:MAG: CoA transferase [Proteobacteria bacterium]|nr:CoA transferase [Pseudomonadota bacterium]
MNKDEFYRNARTDLTGPLAGVRVLEVTTTWAGPMSGVILADMGADVIKVEIPSGDVGRSISPMLPGTKVGFAHATVNRNKRALALDIRKPEGRDLCLDLARRSDIMLENFKVGTMANYGLGYADVCSVKPDIVYVSITGWGQFGPRHLDAGYDPLAQAASGFLSINGHPDAPATKAPTFLADDLGGLHAALGAMAALRYRDQTGEGQHVDVALLDAMLFQSNGLPTLGALGVSPSRMGNEFGFAVPANVYECSDGAVYLGVLLDAHWRILANLLGQPDLADNEAFATALARSANRDMCNMLVSEWLVGQTQAQAVKILSSSGLPIAPVQTYVESATDPHVLERDMLQPTRFADGTSAPITGPAAKFSRTPTRVRTAAADLGQHTDEILAELGLDADARKRLVDAGITA